MSKQHIRINNSHHSNTCILTLPNSYQMNNEFKFGQECIEDDTQNYSKYVYGLGVHQQEV